MDFIQHICPTKTTNMLYMRLSCIFLLLLISFGKSLAQDNDYFYSYCSLHDHPSYKHYSRPTDSAIVVALLKYSRIDKGADRVIFDTRLKKELTQHDNWKNYLNNKKAKPNQLRDGEISTLRNYDQASYAEIKYTPGSLLCTSLYPFEKQYAVNGFKRWINSNVVSRMGMKRLKYYGDERQAPINDFLAEYYFTLFQDTIRKVSIAIPNGLYRTSTDTSYTRKSFYNCIRLVKNNQQLQEILAANLLVNTGNSDSMHPITTALVMTIEGGQCIYGPRSSKKKFLLHPKRITPEIKEELIANVHFIKDLPHRLFFVTPAHFTQNHIVGYAKTIDRDIENFQHRLPALTAGLPFIRNFMVVKNYDGFNPVKNIGMEILEAFLDPSKTHHQKPTYIDVKHMDVKGRIQYYYKRRELERKFGMPIPIIASHFAISGEKQAMAAATGLWPKFDQYPETENPHRFYKNKILISGRWERVMSGTYNKSHGPMCPEEMNMYTSLDFLSPPKSIAYNPFQNYDLDADAEVGWFYPWSLNLFDEEIIEINKSDGIIGLLLDPRQLGAFAPNYKTFEFKGLQEAKKHYQSLSGEEIKYYQLESANITAKEYMKAEPLLRNIFYIIRLILQQQHAQEEPSGYPWFVKDTLLSKKCPWDMIALGTDFDGLIDPIDFAPTSSYLPLMHKKMILFALWYARIHSNEFFDPRSKLPLIIDIDDSKKKMKKIFYSNGVKFIKQYF
jgi:hypothetical protein